MGKMKQWFLKIRPTKRKLVQLYFALLFNANLKGFAGGNIYTGNTKVACVPGINCYSCPGAIGACPLGSLQGSFSADKSTLWYVGGILLLYSILFGRFICGWLCPFGWIQELVYKIKSPKVRKSPVTRVLSYLKYVILVVFVFLIPILYALRDTPLPAFCKYICPAGTLEGGLSLLANKVNASYFSMLGPIFTWKFLLLVSILVGCVFVFRLFCRFLCPLGALYGLFNKLSLFGIKLDRPKCVDCNRCISHCKLDIHHVGDQECIMCGECMSVCPTGAIQWKGGIKLHRNEVPENSPQVAKKQAKAKKITRAVVAVVMAAVLLFSIGYYWVTYTPLQSGNAVGDLCYGVELEVVSGNGPTGETIDPTATGKVAVINFWGTWCTPCVNELPYFDRIASEYPNITVFAVHGMLTQTAPAFIQEYYPESSIVFLNDYTPEGGNQENGYYASLGGSGAYPMTVVLDSQGIITDIFVGSITYDELHAAVENARK